MRTCIALAIFLTLAACSKPPVPRKVADVGGAEAQAAFYLYRPGGILDDYMTLEIERGDQRQTILSISNCSFVAAKTDREVLHAAVFQSQLLIKSSGIGRWSKNRAFPLTTIVKSEEIAPSAAKLIELKQAGYTVLDCKFSGLEGFQGH